jgi:PPE-repeat protein
VFGFEAFPPEINSGLMYMGPGAAPMVAASAAWDALADDLYLAAAAYQIAITDLTSWWLGPSSASMAAAAAPYVAWIGATAVQAQQAGAQAKAAVAAYEAAFMMTVPPAEIAANRALLLALIATNFFGQNTPAIMATEALYIEMWAQDAAAMYGYAGASSAASVMEPFTAPNPTTSDPSGAAGGLASVTQAAGTSAQTVSQVGTATASQLGTATASQLSTATASQLSTVSAPSGLQSVVSSATSSTATSPLSSLTAPTSSSSSTAMAVGQGLTSGATTSASMLTSGVAMLGSSGSLVQSLGPVAGTFGNGFPMTTSSLNIGPGAWASPGGAVSAATGRAASLGLLSVPQGWTSAAPAFSQVASALPAGGGMPVTPASATGGPAGPIGAARAQTAEQGGARSPLAARYNVRPAMVQRPVSAG